MTYDDLMVAVDGSRSRNAGPLQWRAPKIHNLRTTVHGNRRRRSATPERRCGSRLSRA